MAQEKRRLDYRVPDSDDWAEPVRENLSRVRPNGLLGHYHFTGRVIHAETLGFGCVHGVTFTDMTAAEKSTLLDYLCQVEHRYRVAS